MSILVWAGWAVVLLVGVGGPLTIMDRCEPTSKWAFVALLLCVVAAPALEWFLLPYTPWVAP